jgi:hypothetical protein
MLRLFVRMPTGVVPMGERSFLTGNLMTIR